MYESAFSRYYYYTTSIRVGGDVPVGPVGSQRSSRGGYSQQPRRAGRRTYRGVLNRSEKGGEKGGEKGSEQRIVKRGGKSRKKGMEQKSARRSEKDSEKSAERNDMRSKQRRKGRWEK